VNIAYHLTNEIGLFLTRFFINELEIFFKVGFRFLNISVRFLFTFENSFSSISRISSYFSSIYSLILKFSSKIVFLYIGTLY